MHWYDQYDIGLKGNWAAADLDDSTWKTVNVPGGFSELGVLTLRRWLVSERNCAA